MVYGTLNPLIEYWLFHASFKLIEKWEKLGWTRHFLLQIWAKSTRSPQML